MRFIHTSDWHLGREFGPVSLADDQQAFIDWLVALCAERQVELVVIAGDIYDRAVAPVDAVRMFRAAVASLRATGARVAAITGNHDGADRVASYGDMLDLGGVYIRGGYEHTGEVLQLDFDDGPIDLVMLPFLDPQAAPDGWGVGDDPESGDAFTRRIKRTHQSVLQSAVESVLPQLSSPRSLAVSHAFVVGGEVSESERQLVVGGTGTVTTDVFSPFSYTALGHLHRPQNVADTPTLRYSGTPLAYSFSEDHPKSVTMVDIDAEGGCTIEHIAVEVGRGVHTIAGTIDMLLQARPNAEVAQKFVRAIITDPGVVLDAKQRLSAVYPHVVEITLRPTNADGTPLVDAGAVVDRRSQSPAEIATAFWEAAVGAEPNADERGLLHRAIAHAEGSVA